MSKNRRKNLRNIVVDSQEYTWIVTNYNCDGDGGCLFKIWKDKKLIYNELIHNESITPVIVKEVIEGI